MFGNEVYEHLKLENRLVANVILDGLCVLSQSKDCGKSADSGQQGPLPVIRQHSSQMA